MTVSSLAAEVACVRFVVELELVGDGYRGRAENEVEDLGPFPDLPRSEAAATGDERDVRRRSRSSGDSSLAGRVLAEWLFRGKIGLAFADARSGAEHRGQSLLLCIQLDEAPELALEPWEALWDEKNGRLFAQDPGVVIVRTLKKASSRHLVPATDRPLRVWALLPSPEGLKTLSGYREWKRVQENLEDLPAGCPLEDERLRPPTLDTLRKRFESGSCDVLHVASHGEPGQKGQMGLLFLENENGHKDPVPGLHFADALTVGNDPPKLVVLNACHGAHADIDEIYDGLAQHLLRRGVAAVVAMRTSISDKAAVRFAGFLYQRLAEGCTVEEAVAKARRSLSGGTNRAEWATPVLYLGTAGMRLVEPAADDSVPTEELHLALKPPWRRRLPSPRDAAAALVALGIFGAVGWWGSGARHLVGVDYCSSPPTVPELKFVRIQPGNVNVGGQIVPIVGAYCIGQHEVTRKVWKTIVGELPSSIEGEPERPRWPVTHATEAEVELFLKNLSDREPGVTYRLPTQAEWELAARADATTKYFFGDDPSELDRYGNCDNHYGDDGFDGPAPVGSYRPNKFGLFDVHGNVAEWVDSDEDPGKGRRLGGSHDSTLDSCSFNHRSSVQRDAPNSRDTTGIRLIREELPTDETPD